MTEEQEDLLNELCEYGNDSMEDDDFDAAIDYFSKALDIVPEPKENWEASAWLYASIGDALFFKNEYERALDKLNLAYKIYGTEAINPFVLLRLGQCYFHLQDNKNAIDFLLRAYMLAGNEIFEGDDEYFDFLKANVELNK